MAMNLYDPQRNAWVSAVPATVQSGGMPMLLVNILIESKVHSELLYKLVRGEPLGPETLDGLRTWVTSEFGNPY